MQNSDLVEFIDESVSDQAKDQPVWTVLIVDDEPSVHQSTRFALDNHQILGRTIEFKAAYSAAEARAILANEPEFAVILLDVVMEEPDSGLKLVGYIREHLQQQNSRIILRTGQPGYAPELDVIEKYDINDYKSKSELTRTRLITSMTAAIRSYLQIQTINANRDGLMMIIDGSAQLFREKAVHNFSQGVLIQLCSLLQINQNGIFCCFENGDKNEVEVLAAFGKYQYLQGRTLSQEAEQNLLQQVRTALQHKSHQFHPDNVVLYLQTPYAQDLVVWVETSRTLNDIDMRLLEIFSVSVAVGFDNAKLFERVERNAFVDELTGLKNRFGLVQELQKMSEQGMKQQNEAFSLLLFDLDNFQAVNDGLGYELGNQCLLACQQQLQQLFGAEHLLARLSSDNFVVRLPCTDKELLRQQIHALKEAVSAGVSIGPHRIALSLTCGIAQYPLHGEKAEMLLTHASIALKEAKNNARGGFVIFDSKYQERMQQRLELANRLARALQQQELSLLYQPQIDMSQSSMVGVEALLRWNSPQGAVSPAHFIPVAESSGHIVEIGRWVMEQAFCQLSTWLQRQPKLCMAINVSLRQLKDPGFLEHLDALLSRTQVPASNIKLEITESMMMEEHLTLVALVYAIRSRGIKVSIDDFGTGYSSLGYILNLPVDQLKIDRSFVQNLDIQPQKQAIAQLIIGMTRTLNLEVIAEGVEKEEEKQKLLQLGCCLAQGFYFAKPLTAEQVESQWLAQ